jgi:hypothetical protein
MEDEKANKLELEFEKMTSDWRLYERRGTPTKSIKLKRQEPKDTLT